ncbi:MAG: hypothetical protein JNJ71_00915 [Rubrivivax sp.]|nr:hypothetical protein [Rubrivivax sp.]
MPDFPSADPPDRLRRAGLKHALLHDWQQGFPLEPTPFRAVARRLGSSVREVLHQCQALDAEGLAAGISAHWPEALHLQSWRMWSTQQGGDAPAVQAALTALPGLTAWHEREQVLASGHGHDGPALPRLWFDLVARSPETANAQVQALQRAAPWMGWQQSTRAELSAEHRCACGQRDGPCSDPQLARLCETGLPVVARPYRAAAWQLQRSERDLVLTLRRWQRAGRLAHMGLAPRPLRSQSLHTVAALWGEPPSDAAQQVLRAFPGVLSLRTWPGDGGPSLVTAAWLPGVALPLLGRALQAAGLQHSRHDLWAVRSYHVRDEPLLFADIDPPPDAGPSEARPLQGAALRGAADGAPDGR